jgi:hypothetical protein
MVRNKKGAMEMTVGTIVTIVLLMSALVLGLILTKTIFTKTTENVQNIDAQVKGEINDLFGEEGTGFVIRLGNQNTAKVKQGTLNFGIPIGFSPTAPAAWGTNKDNCKYNITPINSPQYCIQKGWNNICSVPSGSPADTAISVKTGCGNTGSGASAGIPFETYDNGNGYSLIKIDIPANVPPCLQRFSITVTCGKIGSTDYSSETVKGAFDIEILKKGIF